MYGHRFIAALVATAVAFAGLAIASTNASAQTSTADPVEQGQTWFFGRLFDDGTALTVEPPEAGTVRSTPVPPSSVDLSFTASSSYRGPAVIRRGGSLLGDFVVVGPRADVGATFTPRPAPGPCILIVSGGTVGFGDVTLGVARTAPTETVVSNCSLGLGVDIFGAVSQATSGTGPGAIVLEPVLPAAGPNQLNYRLTSTSEPLSRLLDNDSSVFVRTLPDGFTRSLNHELTIGAGSTTALNSEFSATVTLVATEATP